MQYEQPRIIDHGTIVEHTFTNAGGGTNDPSQCQGRASPPKDYRVAKLDCFREYSHSS